MLNTISDSIVKLLLLVALFTIGFRVENMIASNREAVESDKKTASEIEKMVASNSKSILSNKETIESHKKLSMENLQLNKDQIILLNEIKNKKEQL